MSGRRSSRRGFLGTVIGGLALLGTGYFRSALADKTLNNGDKQSFQKGCEDNGGTFIDSPKDNLTACFWSDKSKTVCDRNGNDCENYPPPPKKLEETRWADPILGATGESVLEGEPTVVEESIASGAEVADVPLMSDETQTVMPVEAPLEAIAETEVAAPVETQEASVAESRAEAASADVVAIPAEDRIPVETSEEQP